jgi:hypothetical protein
MMYSLTPACRAWAMPATSFFHGAEHHDLRPVAPWKPTQRAQEIVAVHFGMFQSSRMPSGIRFRHASTASSPFSASAISNSSPSRILLATLRMTLESSITKNVFMVSSLHASRADPLRCFVATRPLQQLCELTRPLPPLAGRAPGRYRARPAAGHRAGTRRRLPSMLPLFGACSKRTSSASTRSRLSLVSVMNSGPYRRLVVTHT